MQMDVTENKTVQKDRVDGMVSDDKNEVGI